jgi:hypothetical protein
LFQVSAAGGASQLVLEPAAPGELFLRWPSFLPDGRRFLYFARPVKESSRVYARSLDGAERSSLVLEGDTRAVFSPSGHLLFVRSGVLVAQPVDQVSLRPLGEPKPIAPRVILDHLGLSPPEDPKPPPATPEGLRVPVDDEGYEIVIPWSPRG